MSLALVHSRAQVGVQAPAVSVETHLANGLPHLTPGRPAGTTVKESKDRVRSAIVNSGLTTRSGALPRTSHRPTCPRTRAL